METTPPETREDPNFLQVTPDELIVFPEPIEPKAGYQLLQVEQDQQPEYWPEPQIDARCEELAAVALQAVATLIRRGNVEKATHWAWYAVRAMPRDPLPWRIVHAFFRAEGGDVWPEAERLGPSKLEGYLTSSARATLSLWVRDTE